MIIDCNQNRILNEGIKHIFLKMIVAERRYFFNSLFRFARAARE